MFIRFRLMTAERYGDGARECVGKCEHRPRYYPHHGIGMMVKGRTCLEGCPMKPLCPLKQKRQRLEVSIVETRREAGKVKHKHIASLGSIADDTIAAREIFWRECEARLTRLANRLGPDLDRLRQAIAARIPPLTDADQAAMTAHKWNQLQEGWNGHAKGKVDTVLRTRSLLKREVREAVEAEAAARQAKRLRGNEEVFDALNIVLGLTLAEAALCGLPAAAHETKAELQKLVDQHDAPPGRK